MKNYNTILINSFNNQNHEITTKEGVYLLSYGIVIAFRCKGKTYLDKDQWNDGNIHQARARNKFTGLTTRQTEAAVKNGKIELMKLN